MKRLLKISAAAAAVVMVLAAPAAAEPAVFVEHWTEHDEFLAQERFSTPEEEWCPQVDFPVWVEEDASGTFRLLSHGDSPLYGASTFSSEGSFTNLDNGLTFSFISSGQEKDVHVTDLGGGLLSIEVQITSRTTFYGPDGEKLFLDAGRVSFTLVIDTKGTPSNEDDVEVSFEFGGATGHFQTAGRNFCDDLIEFIGDES
ncbi:hypothetical protein L1785_16090 [Antribacter sp. KLBMP9083]|uniref:Carbohydrate-binding domain-containing protein n=1 Tax=Antribacter soli TaxID=2910976 RepID=A0AA41QI08_9MICO|nr:hypothetical protein [Antribacter soli]MCF4122499.1 hypothetical protein [Antribacter soli]